MYCVYLIKLSICAPLETERDIKAYQYLFFNWLWERNKGCNKKSDF